MRNLVRGRAAAIALLGVFAAGCGSGDSDPESTETPERTTPTIKVERPDGVTPKPYDYELGHEEDFDGALATVLDYRKNVPPRGGASKGNRYDAALVKMCNDLVLPDEDPETVFSSHSWQVTDDDDGFYDPSGTTYRQSPTPQFPLQKNLKPGDCAKGWVIFEVPTEAKIQAVVYALAENGGTWATR